MLFHHQNSGKNHNVKIGNKSFENVADLRYLGMTVTGHKFDLGGN
jgi:hypothetical protein